LDKLIWPLICFVVVFFVLLLVVLWLLGAMAFTSMLPSFVLLTFSFVIFGRGFWLFPLWVSSIRSSWRYVFTT
jgi:hypothetical protein